ncbi:uncharacterized LabA/DUF88 family protein [Natrinema hispanicum]|uniref:Uncharacterized LabA/DUF88 family protein n=1 Tax=Natrinema hispanicum TaxID=392421 RepID=A0A482Y7A8_9EURY|nr:NYN domain-containing protein [Natrinema hispanicum]RZV08763.1 uncharacterized LabA/DUF88 family protein [Natrinema hispanicum]
MSGKATILIDGGYFDNINRYSKNTHNSAVDVHDFAEKLARTFGSDLLRCKFYHALPYLPEDPTDEQQERYEGAQSFFDTIDDQPKTQFEKKGRVKQEHADCPDCGNHFTYSSQKGVDVGIAVDLVEMASDQNSPGAFVLVSGDEDLQHAVRAAKDNHANVFLGYAYDPSASLYSAQQLRQEVDQHVNVVDGFLQDVTL